MPRSCDVGARVMAMLIQTRAVEADETDIDTVVSVLVMSLSTTPRCLHSMAGSSRTWLSKHCVHSSRCTDWLSFGC